MFQMLLATAALVVGTPVKIDAALLAGLPEQAATLDAHGQKLACTGPALSDLLVRLGAPQGKALHGPALAGGVLLRARDGYAVLFSLGEIDPGTGRVPMIVATRCNGAPIGVGQGPYRLIVPNDARPARSLRQLDTIELR